MITEMAIGQLDKVLREFRGQKEYAQLTIGETLQKMSKAELLQLCAKLLLASNNVVQSRL